MACTRAGSGGGAGRTVHEHVYEGLSRGTLRAGSLALLRRELLRVRLCSLVWASTGKDVWPRLEQSHLTWGGWRGVLQEAAHGSVYVYVCAFMGKHRERVVPATPGPVDALAEDLCGIHQSVSQKARQVQRSRHLCGPLCVKLRAGFIFRPSR